MNEETLEQIRDFLTRAFRELDDVSFDSENDPGRVSLAQEFLQKAVYLIDWTPR